MPQAYQNVIGNNKNNSDDENHDHVLTGDLRIIKNSKLGKITTKARKLCENKLEKIMQKKNRDWSKLKHRTNDFHDFHK